MLTSDMSAPTDQVGAWVTRTTQTMRAACRSTERMKANAIASSGRRLSPGLRSNGEYRRDRRNHPPRGSAGSSGLLMSTCGVGGIRYWPAGRIVRPSTGLMTSTEVSGRAMISSVRSRCRSRELTGGAGSRSSRRRAGARRGPARTGGGPGTVATAAEAGTVMIGVVVTDGDGEEISGLAVGRRPSRPSRASSTLVPRRSTARCRRIIDSSAAPEIGRAHV